jgi:CrcB protein
VVPLRGEPRPAALKRAHPFVNSILLVALGGALGSVARYQCGALVLRYTIGWNFPIGTFAVNVLGCLIAGLLIGLGENHALLNAETRLLVFTGFLGGFTTFSAFGVETVSLLEKGELTVAAAYVLSSVLCALAALWWALKIGGWR